MALKRTQANDAEPQTRAAVDHIWEDMSVLEAKIAALEERSDGKDSKPVEAPAEKFEAKKSIDEDMELNGDVAIGGTLDVTGLTSLDGTLLLPHGTGAAPAVSFSEFGDTNPLGFYRIGEGNLGLNIAGEQCNLFSCGSGNSYFYVMSDRTGDDGTDWEALRIRKAPAGDAVISVTAGATGTNRDLYIQTDGTNDIILRTAGTNNRLVIDASAGGVTQVVNGAKATPGYGFINDVDTGIFLNAAGDMRVTRAGEDQGWPVTDHDTAVAYRTSNQSIANATWTTVTYNGTTFDFDSSVSTGSGTFTFSENGTYILTAWVQFTGNSSGERLIRFLKGVTVQEGVHRHIAVNTGQHWMSTCMMAYFNTGTYGNVRFQVFQSSGGALNLEAAYVGWKKLSSGMTKVPEGG